MQTTLSLSPHKLLSSPSSPPSTHQNNATSASIPSFSCISMFTYLSKTRFTPVVASPASAARALRRERRHLESLRINSPNQTISNGKRVLFRYNQDVGGDEPPPPTTTTTVHPAVHAHLPQGTSSRLGFCHTLHSPRSEYTRNGTERSLFLQGRV